jgi:hypothetical protein
MLNLHEPDVTRRIPILNAQYEPHGSFGIADLMLIISMSPTANRPRMSMDKIKTSVVIRYIRVYPWFIPKETTD